MATLENNIGYTVNASSCSADTTYDGFPYCVTVPVSGMLVTDVVNVFMRGNDGANFYCLCDSVAGGVKLFAKNNTFGTAKIQKILIERAD